LDTNRGKKKQQANRKNLNRPVGFGCTSRLRRRRCLENKELDIVPRGDGSRASQLQQDAAEDIIWHKEVALKAWCPLWLGGMYRPPELIFGIGERGWL